MIVFNTFFLLVFLIAYTKTQLVTDPPAPPINTTTVVPSITCWYNRYADGVRTRTALFGYISAFGTNESIQYDEDPALSRNELILDGVRFSGILPVYSPGFDATAFTLPFSFNLVNWTLNSTRIGEVNGLPVILGSRENVTIFINESTIETMCYTVFNGACPGVDNLRVRDYCDDGIFCNGPEICNSGRCETDTTQAPVCAYGCNETTLSCNVRDCSFNNSCVTPVFTCMYTEFNDTSRIYNIFVGYRNSATNQEGGSPMALDVTNHYDTDGIVTILAPITPFASSRNDYVLQVNDATYFRWTIGTNEYAWSFGDTMASEYSCFTVGGGSCHPPITPSLLVDSFCQDASFCNGIEACDTATNRCAPAEAACNNPNAIECSEDRLRCLPKEPTTPDNCIASSSCVVPLLTCVYVSYRDGKQEMNLILGYNNTATQDIANSTLNSNFDTDGESFTPLPFTKYSVGVTTFVYVVTNATYLNLTIGANSYLWTPNMTRDDSFICRAKFNTCPGFLIPDFCSGFSFCSDYTCYNEECIPNRRCKDSTLPVCNNNTNTCDEQVVSAPGPDTDSPNLENTPNSVPIVAIPALIVIGAGVGIYLTRTARPSRMR